MGPLYYSHSAFTLTFSIFILKFLFRLLRSLMFSSLKNCFFLLLSILDKSISGLTDFMSPIFTSRSKRALTVCVLTFVSCEIARNDFLPFSIRELRHRYDQGLQARMQ